MFDIMIGSISTYSANSVFFVHFMHISCATHDMSHTFKYVFDVAEFNSTMDNDPSLSTSIHALVKRGRQKLMIRSNWVDLVPTLS